MKLGRGKAQLKILVARPDRLGDVLLSTPVIAALKATYPHAEITFLVQPRVAPIIGGIPGVDQVWIYDKDGKYRGLSGLIKLFLELRRGQYRIAVLLQTQFKLSFAVFLAGIRYRLGPYAKIHSFLFFNRGMRQRRSLVEMHEADYNLALLRRLGIRAKTRQYLPQAAVSEAVRAEAKTWLLTQGFELSRAVIAVHPGMGGSALNWPTSHYADLIQRLLMEGKQVLMTGGPTEAYLLSQVETEVKALQKGVDVPPPAKLVLYASKVGGAEKDIQFLAGLYSFCSVVVAPSTGPLHLAAALQIPVVTFYPPIRVQSAIRWGPYVPYDQEKQKAQVFVPEGYCGEDFACRGQACHYYPCMRTIPVDRAHRAVNELSKDPA